MKSNCYSLIYSSLILSVFRTTYSWLIHHSSNAKRGKVTLKVSPIIFILGHIRIISLRIRAPSNLINLILVGYRMLPVWNVSPRSLCNNMSNGRFLLWRIWVPVHHCQWHKPPSCWGRGEWVRLLLLRRHQRKDRRGCSGRGVGGDSKESESQDEDPEVTSSTHNFWKIFECINIM